MKLVHLASLAFISLAAAACTANADGAATSANADTTPPPAPVMAEAEPNDDPAHANELGNVGFALSGTVTPGDVDYWHATTESDFRQIAVNFEKSMRGLQIDVIFDSDPTTVHGLLTTDGNASMPAGWAFGEGFLLKVTAPGATRAVTYEINWTYADSN